MVWWGHTHRIGGDQGWGRQLVGMELLVKELGRLRVGRWMVGTLPAQQSKRTERTLH